MRRTLLLTLAALLLTACGSYAPAAPLSELEERQTAIALQGRPTLAPLSDNATTPTPRPTPRPAAELLDLSIDDPRSLGSPEAPVLMVEFTDFECPFCNGYVRETRPQLLERFVDTGMVRIVARDFPVTQIHPAAMVAAVAGRCAAAQDQFWPMYEWLFATHGVEWGGFPERDSEIFAEFAAELGLDQAAFVACQADPAVEAAVQAEFAAAEELRVNATPTFLINGRLLVGAQSLPAFERLFEQAAGR